MDIYPLIARHFPLGRKPLQLDIVEPDEPGEDPLSAHATIRLIVWERSGDDWAIRDIKEQQIVMGPAALYRDVDRVAAFFSALGDAIGEIGELAEDAYGALMPYELLPADALELKRAATAEDFARALRAKRRLGPLLGA